MIGATAAALAAGTYFFKSKLDKRQAGRMKGWMVRMKGDIIERLEGAEEITESIYRKIIDAAANAEMVGSKVPRSEILQLATDLKRQWKTIRRLSGAKRKTR